MLGLALEGGGAKGAFHMGAVKAYFDEGYHFDGVTGTSIGALNGAIIAQGDFEIGYQWWQGMDIAFLLDIDKIQIQNFLNRKIDKDVLVYLFSKLKDIVENRGLDTKKIRETLDNIVVEEKLRASKIDFGLVTVSVSDLKPLELYKEDIPLGKLVDYLMASANFPAFKIEPIEGKFYIDGGFYDNCPINLLIRKGYKEVIAIRTLGMGLTRKLEDAEVKVTNIIPSEDLGRILNFDQNLIQINLKMGYFDAMRIIKGLKGRRYYIEPIDNDLIFNSLLSMPEDVIYEMGRIMHLPEMEPKRLLFEQVFPTLSRILGFSTTSTYQDILLGVLEYMAEEKGINKYKIWSLLSFWEVIKSNDNDGVSPPISFISDIVKTAKLKLISPNDVALKEIAKLLLIGLRSERFPQ
ncbi:MAG: patatin-like phospholipase family protein [Desulfitobacteriaceae bacterium]